VTRQEKERQNVGHGREAIEWIGRDVDGIKGIQIKKSIFSEPMEERQ
jgi:hypothetical protein